ncbi:hypothetical protein ANCCAN_22793 [Ancylostoma caninum]|uniref:EGF-like domain-containing protein n=1 Tax=Ancylostoma caninum TaxID=29170 RepID=A0A368FH84_ANCCA|nr:hypothetical protein ANCCAN_22793 [Ancylostoma caninum]
MRLENPAARASRLPSCNNKSYCPLRFACECKPGYVLEDSNLYSKCVPISSCGKSTPEIKPLLSYLQ